MINSSDRNTRISCSCLLGYKTAYWHTSNFHYAAYPKGFRTKWNPL